MLDHVLPEIDNRIATIDDLVDKTFHASSVVQAGKKGEDNLVIAHVRFAELFQQVGLGCEEVDSCGVLGRKVYTGQRISNEEESRASNALTSVQHPGQP
jgi:hypothetical protein